MLLGLGPALATGTTACGSGTADRPADPPPPTAVPRLDALRLVVAGGFTTAAIAFRTVPELTITDDGRVLTPAPVTALYPGPILTQLTERSIDAEGRAAVADVVVRSGLVTSPPPDLGSPNVADAPTTTLTLTVGGAETTVVAPALAEALDDDPALTPGQREARARLREVVDRLRDLTGTVGSEHLGRPGVYVPRAVWLRALPAPTDRPPEDPGPTLLPWPVPEVDLATLDSATLVEGPEAEAVLEVVEGADELTWFRPPGSDTTYELFARPAVPGDPPDGSV